MHARFDVYKRSPSIRIVSAYLSLAIVWILLSDRFLSEQQTVKGLSFVVVSGLLMGYLIHRAWQAYEYSEKRFQAVVERAGDIITIIDRDGSRKYHSPMIAEVLGYSQEAMLGRDIFEFVHPDDQEMAREVFRNIASWPNGATSVEVRVFHADHSLRHLSVTATNLLDDAAVNGIVLNTRDISERKEAELHAQRQLERLAALHTVDLAILENQDLDATLDVVLDQIRVALGVDACSILLCNSSRSVLTLARCAGFQEGQYPRTRIGIGDRLAGQAVLEGCPQIVPRIADTGGTFACAQLAPEEGFAGYVAIPLVAKGETKGVLELFSRNEFTPDPEWLSFASALAAQAAIAIDDAQLFSGLKQANAELEAVYDRTLEGWAKALEFRDDETEGHSRRVVDMALRLARKIGIDEEELVHVRRGALLHDIGKIGIPDTILLKPGSLDEEEWQIMRKHPLYAYDLLKSIPYLAPALTIPRYHHERWNGSGYPYGLRGEEIPITARLFAVVDVLDALTSDRPYRMAWSWQDALDYLEGESGKLFDPDICRTLLDSVTSFRPVQSKLESHSAQFTAHKKSASGV